MEQNKRRFSCRMALCAALVAGLLSGCAQPQYTDPTIKRETKTDFGSGIDLAVSYHGQPDGGVVVTDIYNQRARMVRAWFWHQQETDGQKVLRGIRYYEGDKIKHREVFQIPPADDGLTEVFWIEVYEEEGKKLTESKPIRNTANSEGGMP